jgi:YesN/AraC family two-component response regulator
MQGWIKVLIVDDQPRSRNSVRALLSTWSWIGEVREATNGREALDLVREFEPDVVLMDVRMPEIDGLKATVQIKALWPWVKVIVLSMYTEYRDEALAAGADIFVSKGEAPEKLLDVLAAVVQKGV